MSEFASGWMRFWGAFDAPSWRFAVGFGTALLAWNIGADLLGEIAKAIYRGMR
jgi:hypothetical protein